MYHLILLRHGQSQWNLENRFTGWTDVDLTEKGREAGLVKDDRYAVYLKRREEYAAAKAQSEKPIKPKDAEPLLSAAGGTKPNGALTAADLVRRGVALSDVAEKLGGYENISRDVLDTVETDAKYEGYLQKEQEQIDKAIKYEEKTLPKDIDYLSIKGLRLEARQKLDKIRPENLGQASRISGVSPADITVLMVYLKSGK